MKTTLRGKWTSQFMDTKVMENGGYKATQGFVPSAWGISPEQEREILLTPTVTADVHLLATSCFGYMTLSNINLRILGANVHNKTWTESTLEQRSDLMLTAFIGNHEEVLRTMNEETKRQSLRFDMSAQKRVLCIASQSFQIPDSTPIFLP